MNFRLLVKHISWISAFVGSALVGGFAIAPSVSAKPAPQVSEPYQFQTLPSQSQPIQYPSVVDAAGSMLQLRVVATPIAPQNPCPKVYYEAPYNQYIVLPTVCTPNAIMQRLAQMGVLEAVRAQAEQGVYDGVGGPYPDAPDIIPTRLPDTSPKLIPAVPSRNYNQ
jgi:hypothetical protein